MEKETPKSMYHGGFLYNERIHGLLTGLDQVTIERETETDNKTLMRLFRQNYGLLVSLFKELFGEMKKPMQKEQRETWVNVRTVFNKTKTDFANGTRINLNFVVLFDEWELELRNFAQERGLIMPDSRSMLEATEI